MASLIQEAIKGSAVHCGAILCHTRLLALSRDSNQQFQATQGSLVNVLALPSPALPGLSLWNLGLGGHPSYLRPVLHT